MPFGMICACTEKPESQDCALHDVLKVTSLRNQKKGINQCTLIAVVRLPVRKDIIVD